MAAEKIQRPVDFIARPEIRFPSIQPSVCFRPPRLTQPGLG